ncbi:MAG: Gldg family protein [Anaerolineales bacterium]|jgi:ABC-type uncharacterized transport system involved in gliding motility auxiliary subunit
MKIDRGRAALISYLVALVVLLAAGAWYIVNRQFDIYMQIGLGLVVVGIAAGILLDPQRVRKALTGRRARYGGNALLLTLAVIGILVVINFLVFNNPARVDLTEDQVYSLSVESILAISDLTQNVQIKGFFTPDLEGQQEAIRPLLEEYHIESQGKVEYEFIDPIEDIATTERYGVTYDGSLVVVVGEASEIIQFPEEQEITSAIVRLTNPGARTIYFLTGHGERDLDDTDRTGYSQLKSVLLNKNYTVSELNLLAEPEIPDDALVVVIARPTSAVTQNEVDLLSESGVGIIYLQDPIYDLEAEADDFPLITYFQSAWGLVLHNDLIIDSYSFSGTTVYQFSYGEHVITNRLHSLASYFSNARSMEIISPADPLLQQTGLVMTGNHTWGETDLETLFLQSSAEANPDDYMGPLMVAAAAENTLDGTKVVVFGDSDFAANGNFGEFGNGDLIVNSIDWAAGQEDLIDLTPKEYTSRYVVLPTVRTLGLIFLVSVIVIPGTVIGLGISTWLQRRKVV